MFRNRTSFKWSGNWLGVRGSGLYGCIRLGAVRVMMSDLGVHARFRF